MLNVIAEKLEGGQALNRKDALYLLQQADLLALGRMADGVRRRLHPQGRVTFVVDRNVNYTNVCRTGCRFCAFYRQLDDSDAYLLSHAQILDKVAELAACGGTQLLLQGGLHPELRIAWFEELFRRLRRDFPGVQIHSLSPAEIVHLANQSGLTVEECLRRLQAAGLASLPGGGAEILVDRVRRRISPDKIGWRKWVEVMETAHRMGLPGTATMMFGAGETDEDIVTHLLRVRALQQRTNGFSAFIPWSYQPGNTELGGEEATGIDYLRVLAVSRLVLHNIPNIQGSWVTQGGKLAQVALFFGANDLGGTMLEENVVAAAGATFRLDREELLALVREAGFVPARRTTGYEILEEYV
ncbi:dehypoxanthinylfutalosine cyclase, putative [Syntrophotalea carbinolica DSM 2380]|uniref:Cyclic dehypoxanthine futalosine synthase n=1 Tax=Syntrophotalea carbinolica (strain DSM 2380 / NBRC 103641 / GraBd1) TaxID=338963 RepID=Q3A7R4_SYNC1|nr:cyclic dehypoxanthinyl futalosine synthase [Syntrophotalea carbinolica]ABA87580.1 dehypoxanthinylfutalosine cyclase, putative [Syntrophotalea carbinolica DSM 2380]